MRNVALVLALATTALATPALARPAQSWYVGIEGGAVLAEDQLFDITRTNGVKIDKALKANYKVGYDVDGIIGYDFGGFRAEFEIGYKDNRVDSFGVNAGGLPVFPIGLGAGVPAVGNYTSAAGNARELSFMTNGLFDFGGKEPGSFGGFVGGGVGVARVKQSHYQFVKFGGQFLDDSDTRFAWQLLAGVYKPLSQHVDLTLKYRFFNVENVRTFTVPGPETHSRWRSHSLLVGLTYRFGEDAPLPPPPAPAPLPAPAPAPLPPCPPAAVTPGPFLVFFDWDRSVVTAEAAAILDRAADQYAATGQTSVVLAGHADKSGTDDYNQALSQRRADAVKRYMVGKGVAEGVITTEAFGETRPLVDTADGVREPQNRRVEITFGGTPQPSTGPCTPQ